MRRATRRVSTFLVCLTLLVPATGCRRSGLSGALHDDTAPPLPDPPASPVHGEPAVDAPIAIVPEARPPEPPPPPPSNNLIDVAIWPRMIREGTTDLIPASNIELCRRMALDLIGRAPSTDEAQAICGGATAEQIARRLIAHPRFVERERMLWIQHLRPSPVDMMGDHLSDADRIIDALSNGAIGYDDFVAQMLARPVMTVNRPVAAGVEVTIENIFRVFLGRLPQAAERADYDNLLRVWVRGFEDRYDLDFAYYVRPAFLEPAACSDPILAELSCTSELLGARTTINLPLDLFPMVPAGYSQTREGKLYYEMVHGAVPAALQTELEKPGRLLATRAELWDEAAEHALARFLGWWKSTANEPETVLPEVRRALAEWFRARPDHDLRELYVVILTSLLYTTSAEVGDEIAERTPWAAGPTKVMSPEQLLDSVAAGLERPIGFCDPHTDEPVGRNWYWPARFRRQQPADFYGFGSDRYYAWGQQMGGCAGAIPPPRAPGLRAVFTHVYIADELCAPPSRLLPEGFDPQDRSEANLDRMAGDLFLRLLLRPPLEEEATAIRDRAVASCGGNCDVANVAREVCGAILRSASFLYY